MKRLEKPNWYIAEERRQKRWRTILSAFATLAIVGGGIFVFLTFFQNGGITVEGSVITVAQGGNLQTAIDRARPGDTIVLRAGGVYKGSFELKEKTGAEFITITTSDLERLPKEGVRVKPSDASAMPKILSSGGGVSAIRTAARAHHYRFIGIEFAPAGTDYVYNLISLGTDDQKLEDVPKNFEFDRCLIRPNPNGKTRRGIMLNSADTTIINSHIAGFAYREEETQAIAGWNGPGGYKIINNYLEAGAENVLVGGADPSIPNLVPSNIEIRGNYMTKPPEWRGKVTIKCAFELKNARNVRVIGNIFENSFDDMAVRLTVRNQSGKAPWSTIEEVVFQHNIVRRSGGGINILGRDDTYPSAMMKRVQIIDNLFEDISGQRYGGDGRFIMISQGEDVAVENNTVFNDGNVITTHGGAARGFVFRNNIVPFNKYGFNGGDGEALRDIFPKYLPGAQITGNLFVNNRKLPKDEIYVPSGNQILNDFRSVGFVSLESGDYKFAANSKFKDRRVGCDFGVIQNETRGGTFK